MPVTRKQKVTAIGSPSSNTSFDAPTSPANTFDPTFAKKMKQIIAKGLTPASALDLVMRLIAEVPAASKESIDQIKMLDKLINTGRAMMETKLKTDEAAAIAARLDELERRMEGLATSANSHPTEIVTELHHNES